MLPDQSLRDSLTQVYSRSSLGLRLTEEVNRSIRYKNPFSILLLDIDYFKSVNDAFGHPRGDLVLIELAKRLMMTARKTDFVFRYGGDEFVILLPNTDREQATRLGERLNSEIRTIPFEGKQPLNITISIGIACFPEDAGSAEELFEVADQRHYRAKFDGRDRLVSKDAVVSKGMPVETFSRLIGRDQSMEVLNKFLDTLPNQGRGVLKIRGGAGSGTTRFMAESRKSANLRGFATLNFRGSFPQNYRFRSILFSAIQEAVSSGLKTDEVLIDQVTEAQLDTAIAQWINEKGKSGLLITLDDLQFIDQGSLAFVRSLFFSSLLPTVGLVYTDPSISAKRGFPFDISLQAVTTLEPLSAKDVLIWVRNSLKWEAPPEFIEWLHRESEGKPAKIHTGLQALIHNHLLTSTENGWQISKDYREISLAKETDPPFRLPSGNFPELHNELVGRTREVKFLQDLLVTQRWVTIHGPGGIGKSRLAMQVAIESSYAFPDGVFYLSVQNISTIDQFLYHFANLFGIDGLNYPPPQHKLIDLLGEKNILIVVDNLDRLPDALPILAAIISQTSLPHCLVTTRLSPKLDLENPFELTGLPCPKGKDAKAIESFPSIQLFLQIVRRIQPGFLLDEEVIPSLIKVCKLVGGNPLGIELAAGLIKVVPCKQIAERIEQNPSTLETEPQGEPRYTGLLAILDSFWQLLSQAEQAILLKLTLFETGFNEESARTVAGASIFFLEALSEKNLVVRTSTGRFELEEFLRQNLLQKFRAFPDELERSKVSFVNFFATKLRFLLQRFLKNEPDAYNTFQSEFENIRNACKWAVLLKLATNLSDLIESCAYYFELNRQFYAGLEFFTFVLSAFQDTKIDLRDGTYKLNYGKVMAILGKCKAHLGMYQESMANLEESLEIFRQCGAMNDVAYTLTALADPVRAIGDYSRASSLLEESLALFRTTDQQEGIGDVLFQMGVIAFIQRGNIKAERLLLESLSIFEALKMPVKVARSINFIGKLLAEGGRFEEAKSMLEGSLSVSEANHINDLTVSIYNSLGDVLMEMGCLDQSEKIFHSGIQKSMEMKTNPLTLELLTSLSRLWTIRGEKEKAYEVLLSIRDHPATTHISREKALFQIKELQNQLSSLPGPSKSDNLEDMLMIFLQN